MSHSDLTLVLLYWVQNNGWAHKHQITFTCTRLTHFFSNSIAIVLLIVLAFVRFEYLQRWYIDQLARYLHNMSTFSFFKLLGYWFSQASTALALNSPIPAATMSYLHSVHTSIQRVWEYFSVWIITTNICANSLGTQIFMTSRIYVLNVHGRTIVVNWMCNKYYSYERWFIMMNIHLLLMCNLCTRS